MGFILPIKIVGQFDMRVDFFFWPIKNELDPFIYIIIYVGIKKYYLY